MVLLLAPARCGTPSPRQPARRATTTTTTITTTTTTTAPSAGGAASWPVDPVTGRFRTSYGSLTTLWVAPGGNDAASGTSSSAALATLAEAWRRIPSSTTLSTGFRVLLRPGRYAAGTLPSYLEHRWGTSRAPVVIESEVPGRAVLGGDLNVFDVRHLYVLGVAVDRAGDAFHCERCSNVLLRRVVMNGRGAAQEVVKFNQSDHVFVEDSDLGGAWDNAVDMVAVQYGHLLGNVVHDAGDWCAYAKGGSAYLLVEGNEFHSCGTGGFTAGQGTGFEFMAAPWLRYEAYGIAVVNNVVHDTDGAGLGVNGGYNVLLAYNTLYRVGARSHVLEVVHGARGCDGDAATCTAHRTAGGWGSASADGQWIPNRHVVVANNLVMNPPGYQSGWQHLQVAGPVVPPAGSGVPNPSLADDDLRIVGNVVWNGGPDMPLGTGDGCRASNPVCNDTQLRRDNKFNSLVPQLVDPTAGRWAPVVGTALASRAAVTYPAWSWTDAPPGVPPWPQPAVTADRAGRPRTGAGHPGAYEP